MKELFLYCAGFFLAFAVSCSSGVDGSNPDGNYEPVYREYFIGGYLEYDKMSVYGVQNTIASLDLRGQNYWYKSTDPVETARYREYAELYGDTSFKRKISPVIDMGIGCTYACDIDAIDVRSDRAWDETHPAGSPLGDVIRVQAISYGPYVRSGYQGAMETAINKPIGELKKGDLSMILAGSVRLCFPEPPSDRDDHTLTVTLTSASGTVLNTSFSLKVRQ